MNKKLLVAVAAVLVFLFLLVVWPTPYRYHSHGTALFREHRITGKLETIGMPEKGEYGWTGPVK